MVDRTLKSNYYYYPPPLHHNHHLHPVTQQHAAFASERLWSSWSPARYFLCVCWRSVYKVDLSHVTRRFRPSRRDVGASFNRPRAYRLSVRCRLVLHANLLHPFEAACNDAPLPTHVTAEAADRRTRHTETILDPMVRVRRHTRWTPGVEAVSILDWPCTLLTVTDSHFDASAARIGWFKQKVYSCIVNIHLIRNKYRKHKRNVLVQV